MAAGLTKRFISLEDIVNLVPESEAKKIGSYKNNINLQYDYNKGHWCNYNVFRHWP